MCRIETQGGKITVGVIYRSPSISKEDDEKLHQVIADISRGNCIIMGDFNYPGINWNYLESAADSEAFLLLMQDCFLTQHVLEPVRGGNVLHIVLSSQNELINDLRILEPLEKGGHSQIHFNLMINNGYGRSKQKKRDFH